MTARRIAHGEPTYPGAPVICVGNLTLGGVGKTPVVRELARRLARRGYAVQALSRGHGGRLHGPARVDGVAHSAADVGDEALMLAGDMPMWVARDRRAGALAAAASGADIIIMDDGHQNPTLKKALSLIVVDGETRDDEWPFGDGAVFPCGPMREPLRAGLARADAVVLMMPSDLAEPAAELLALFDAKPILIARLAPAAPPPSGRLLGFAGIGKPWKMERALKAAGCDLADFVPLPDHAPASETTLRRLARRADLLGARLVTSEKDWIRLSPTWRDRVTAWPVCVRFEDEELVDRLVDRALGRA